MENSAVKPPAPELVDLRTALRSFAFPPRRVESLQHIIRLHWYTALRLVVEGGFDPRFLVPRPPLFVETRGRRSILHHDPSAAQSGERTLLGGLKTKKLDVTVSIPGVGPVLAISLKGTRRALRNLTNRMEEAAGDCTNLHMAYPALVYGFWHVIRANEESDPHPNTDFELEDDGRYKAADVAVRSSGSLAEGLDRYARALARLSDRGDLREPPSRYEACALTLVACRGEARDADLYPGVPGTGGVLDMNRMFQRLYDIYDERFVYQAPGLEQRTRRRLWSTDSPVISGTLAGSPDFSEMAPRLE